MYKWTISKVNVYFLNMKKILWAFLATLIFLPAGAQELIVISSPALHADDSILVFIPVQYADNYSDRYCEE